MKSLFDPAVFDQTAGRIDGLQPAAARQWGKMTPSQMLEHTTRALETACGKGPQKQFWLGKLIGWAVLKNFVGEQPLSKNSPTSPEFVVHDEPDFEATKQRLLSVMREFQSLGEHGCDGHIHGFFGRLSGAQWGVLQFKHLDHHLRQFGA